MADIQKAIVVSGVHTNIINTATGKSENYKEVLTWYDGSTMTNAKCDGDLYRRKGTKFLRKVIDKDGQLFLEKDTMAQVRALTAYEVLLLKAGVVKGVRLSGYYTKGDTPAAIDYYIVNDGAIDDGGSTIILNDTTTKLRHDFLGYVHVSYFGVREGSGRTEDNTDRYTNIINHITDKGVVEWGVNKVYHGHFSSTKPLTLLGNGSTISDARDANSLIVFQGVVLTEAITASPVSFGSDTITVSDSSGIAVDDIVVIHDQQLRPSNNLVINLEPLVVKEVVSATQIKVHDIVRSVQNVGTVFIDIVKPIIGVQIQDFKLKSTDLNSGNQIHVAASRNVTIKNITTENNSLIAVSLRNVVDSYVDNITLLKPRLNGPGQGYGVAPNRCRNLNISNVTGYEMRHSIDLAACYVSNIKNIYDYGSSLPIMIAHNTFGGSTVIEDVYVDGNPTAAVLLSGQGISGPEQYTYRDLTVRNIRHTIPTLTPEQAGSNIGSVRLECPLTDLVVDNVETITTDLTGYVLLDRQFDSVIRCIDTAVNGFWKITNIKSNKLNRLLTISAANAGGNQGVISFDRLQIKEGNSIGLLGGVARFSIGEVICAGALPAGDPLFTISASTISEANMVGIIHKSNTNPVFSTEPTLLINGTPTKVSNQNESVRPVTADTVIGRVEFDCRTRIKLTYRGSSNITIASSKFFPDPIFKNEEMIVQINDKTEKGAYQSIIVPASNTNLVNHNGGFGVTFRSGHVYKLTAGIQEGSKVWYVTSDDMFITPALTNVSQADLANITASDLQAVQDYINNTLVPLVNSIKSSQNSELANQKAFNQNA